MWHHLHSRCSHLLLILTFSSTSLHGCKLKENSQLQLFGDSEQLTSYPSWLITFTFNIKSNRSNCAGAYIGEGKVLTAAHCIYWVQAKPHSSLTKIIFQPLFSWKQKQTISEPNDHPTGTSSQPPPNTTTEHLTPSTTTTSKKNVAYRRRGGFGAKDRIVVSAKEMATKLMPAIDNPNIKTFIYQNEKPKSARHPAPLSQADKQALLEEALLPEIGTITPEVDPITHPQEQNLWRQGAYYSLTFDDVKGGCPGDSGSPITVTIAGIEYLFGVVSKGFGDSSFSSNIIATLANNTNVRGRNTPCGNHVLFPSIPFYHSQIQTLLHSSPLLHFHPAPSTPSNPQPLSPSPSSPTGPTP